MTLNIQTVEGWVTPSPVDIDRDCFPDDEEDFQKALAEVQRSGRVWLGGGGAPLTILMRT